MGKLARTDLRLIVMFTYSVSYEYAYFATAVLACLIRVSAPDLAGICHAVIHGVTGGSPSKNTKILVFGIHHIHMFYEKQSKAFLILSFLFCMHV